MTLNVNGEFLQAAVPNWKEPDDIKLPPLVIPDKIGPWALRYVWIRHRERNDEFVEKYFTEGSSIGLNVRKQTTHLQESWNPHNDIHNISGANGDLVWRVKVLNKPAKSIDYVEVWRSPGTLRRLWAPKSEKNPDGRSKEDIDALRFGLYESGFEVRYWSDSETGWPTVSKLQAMGWYKHFIQRWKDKDGCIINTQWKRELNPILPLNQIGVAQ